MKQVAIDTPIAAAAVSSPLWIQYIEMGGTLLLTLGGVALLGFRLAMAVYQWRHRDEE